ncbi:MAG: cytidylate kinase-like family protein [Desulfatiglandaceae bacterium]
MPLITLTAGIGCGITDVAEQVARELKVELFDDQRLQKVAVDIGFSSQDLKAFDVKAPGLLDRMFRRSPETYHELMEAVIYEVARHGDGVIIGHGSSFFLKDFGCALHIRLGASHAFRTEWVASQRQIDPRTAANIIAKRDTELKGFLHFTFKMDWDDLSLYDLVINVEKIEIETAAELIVHLSQTEAIAECSLTAMEAMERLSLLKRVEAAVTKANIHSQELEIEVPDPGVVKLTGLINPMHTVAGVTEVIRQVPGVAKIISEAERHPLAEL